MGIIYQTEQIYTGPFINVHNLDPVKQWSKHYGNYLYLKFIYDNTKNWAEKRDANKEMGIAQKKMDYWYKMDKTKVAELATAKKELDVQWNIK